MTGMADYFSNLLKKTGISNFLILGIVIIVMWLLISGIRKGLRKGTGGKEDQGPEE